MSTQKAELFNQAISCVATMFNFETKAISIKRLGRCGDLIISTGVSGTSNEDTSKSILYSSKEYDWSRFDNDKRGASFGVSTMPNSGNVTGKILDVQINDKQKKTLSKLSDKITKLADEIINSQPANALAQNIQGGKYNLNELRVNYERGCITIIYREEKETNTSIKTGLSIEIDLDTLDATFRAYDEAKDKMVISRDSKSYANLKGIAHDELVSNVNGLLKLFTSGGAVAG